MAVTIHMTGGLTDAQITQIYADAERFGVGIQLWGDTPSPNRDAFRWGIDGSYLSKRRFVRHLEEAYPAAPGERQ